MWREGRMSIPEAPFDSLESQMSDDPSSTGEMAMLYPIHNIKSAVVWWCFFSFNNQVPKMTSYLAIVVKLCWCGSVTTVCSEIHLTAACSCAGGQQRWTLWSCMVLTEGNTGEEHQKLNKNAACSCSVENWEAYGLLVRFSHLQNNVMFTRRRWSQPRFLVSCSGCPANSNESGKGGNI